MKTVTKKPAPKPAAKPVAKPAAKPVAKPVAKPAAKPVAKPASKPEAKKPEAKKPVAKKALPMKDHVIIAVHITDRLKKVPEVQALLSKYGCNIKTRIGLHETSHEVCSANGILLLEMFGETKKCLQLAVEMNRIEGIKATAIQFSHEV